MSPVSNGAPELIVLDDALNALARLMRAKHALSSCVSSAQFQILGGNSALGRKLLLDFTHVVVSGPSAGPG
jgi:hypothetical protein